MAASVERGMCSGWRGERASEHAGSRELLELESAPARIFRSARPEMRLCGPELLRPFNRTFSPPSLPPSWPHVAHPGLCGSCARRQFSTSAGRSRRTQIAVSNKVEFGHRVRLLTLSLRHVGEAWGLLAHCYVMTDELDHAYHAYQNALMLLSNPRDPNLWYGIGLLYDRYRSLDHALDAFRMVLEIAPDFERAEEVCFCIGIIYKERKEYNQ